MLGGTAANDTLISSIGDDTLYGDDGDDRLDGGDGIDMVFGGAGDDIITDLGGDDLIQGQDGNDAIHGGNGINLILAGFGNDFVVTGEDASESFGGFGDDFMLGVRANEFVFGNEGDDWIETGMVDGAAGDNFDPFGLDPIRGNDVFIGEGLTDRMDGEGGDDIMVGNGGDGDRYEGFSGFDWAVFKNAPTRRDRRSDAARNRRDAGAELAASCWPASRRSRDYRDRHTATSCAATTIRRRRSPSPEPTAACSRTSRLIGGLQAFLNTLVGGAVTSFGAGNIILGGSGSDLIEGRGGDDLIDGDMWLNVRIGGVDIDGVPIGDDIDSMTDIQARVFAGEINPGDLQIVREIVGSPTEDFDTAIFSGALLDADGNANYTIAVNGTEQDVTGEQITIADGDIVTVTDLNGIDGTDTLRNIERLQFTDQALVINGRQPAGPSAYSTHRRCHAGRGSAVDRVGGGRHRRRQLLQPDGGAITGPITYFWQQEVREACGRTSSC